MQQNILIISFNNLGLSFWDKQLNIENKTVYLIKKPETITNYLVNYNPDLIIVDTYFTDDNNLAVLNCFKELDNCAIEKSIFHFSPKFSSNLEMTTSLKGVFQTVLSNQTIRYINELINPNFINDLTA